MASCAVDSPRTIHGHPLQRKATRYTYTYSVMVRIQLLRRREWAKCNHRAAVNKMICICPRVQTQVKSASRFDLNIVLVNA